MQFSGTILPTPSKRPVFSLHFSHIEIKPEEITHKILGVAPLTREERDLLAKYLP